MSLIIPIIDIKTYNSDENKFSPEQIFSDKKNYYSINLNIFPYNDNFITKIPQNPNFKGCLVKIINHIEVNIYFYFESLIIIESNLLNKNNNNYDEFDETRNTCFGNFMKSKNGKGYFKKINFNDIYLFLRRVYYFNKTRCEI